MYRVIILAIKTEISESTIKSKFGAVPWFFRRLNLSLVPLARLRLQLKFFDRQVCSHLSLTVIICFYLQFGGHLQWLIRCLEFGRHLLCNGSRRQLFALTGLSKYTFICILSCNELHLSRVWFLKLRRYISRSCNAAHWQRIPRLFSRFFFNCAALVAREVDVLVGRVKHLLGLYLNVHCTVYGYTRANSLGLGSAEWQLERRLSLLLALKNRVLCW